MVVNLHIASQTGGVPNGTRLSLYSWQNNNDQKWIIERVGDPVLLRLARDTTKVINRHSTNNNAHVWSYSNTAATNWDSLIDTNTENNNTRIKLVGRNVYLTKNANDNFLSWASKIESSRQYFKLLDEKDYLGGGIPPVTKNYQFPLEISNYTTVSGGEFGAPRLQYGPHDGVDFACASGSVIRAMADGYVIYATRGSEDLGTGLSTVGNFVTINHDLGASASVGKRYLRSFYLHMLNAPLVAENSYVTKGTIIGYVGSTGTTSTGNHLHFGIQTKSTPMSTEKKYKDSNATMVDPLTFFNTATKPYQPK